MLKQLMDTIEEGIRAEVERRVDLADKKAALAANLHEITSVDLKEISKELQSSESERARLAKDLERANARRRELQNKLDRQQTACVQAREVAEARHKDAKRYRKDLRRIQAVCLRGRGTEKPGPLKEIFLLAQDALPKVDMGEKKPEPAAPAEKGEKA